MVLRTQYQQLAQPIEPVAPRAEAPELSWFQPASEPVRLPGRIVAEHFYTRPAETSYLRSQALDWTMQPVDVIRPRAQAIHAPPTRPVEPSGFLEPPRLPLFVTMDPVRRPATIVPTGRYVQSWLNSWYSAPGDYLYWAIQQNEPVRQKPRLVTEGATVRPLDQALALPPLTWFRPANPPLRRNNLLVSEGKWAGVLFPTEAPLSWLQPIALPVRRQPHAPKESGFAFVADPDGYRVTVDKWHGIARDPVRPRAPHPHGGSVAPPDVPNVVYLGWFTLTQTPRRELPRLTPSVIVGPVAVLPGDPLNIPRVDWFVRAQEPVRRLPQALQEFAYVPAPELVTVATVDKWYRQTGEPIRVAPRRIEGGAVAPADAPNVVYLGWAVQQPGPVRTKATPLPDTSVYLPLVLPGDPLNIPRVDWFVRAQEPVRRLPQALQGFVFVPEPELVTVATVDKWHRQTGEPVRVAPRRIEGGAVAPADAPNVVYLGWAVQQPGPVRLPRGLTPAPLALVIQTQPTVYLDWTQPTQQPPRVRAPNVADGRFATVSEPSLYMPLPTPFVWYRPLCEPTRLPLRLMLGHFGFRFPRPIAATSGRAQASQIVAAGHAQASQVSAAGHAQGSQVFTPHAQAGEVSE